MRKIAQFFIENHKLTMVFSLFVLIFGLGGLRMINSESFPPVDFAMAIITTSYDGASALDVETKITKPIEEQVRTVSGIKDVRSVSQPGFSRVFVRADIDNVDVQRVMADLQRAVDRVTDLPDDLRDPPQFQEIKSEEFPVVELAVVGSNENRARDLVADALKEDLEDNKSILNVRPAGLKKRQFQVILDHNALLDYHIGINEVIQRVQSRNVNVPGGHLKQASTQQLLRIEGKISDKKDLENLPIRANFSGQQVLLKDVAKIEDGEEEATVLALYNGEPATLLVVTKKGGADTLQLVHDIDEKIQLYREKYKEKFRFEVYNNEAKRVKNRLEVLNSNALQGLVLVVLFLFIFLPGKIGILASLSLPFCVLMTLGFMPIYGMNLNAITILALVIALGMLVDNSVVVSENFARLRQEGYDPMEAALKSVEDLWKPITATVLTTVAAFLPMLVTKGIMGEFIKFIPIVVSIALMASLFEAFIFLPMRLRFSGKTKIKTEGDWFEKLFVGPFNNMVDFCVRHRYLGLASFVGLFIVSILMLTVFNKFILFPPDQTEIYVGRVEMPAGTRLEKTEETVKKFSTEARKILGEHLKHVVGRAGVSQTHPTDPKAKEGNAVGLLILYVDDYAKNNMKHTEVLAKLREIPVAPDEGILWEALVNGPPVGEAVNVTFRSNDDASLAAVVSKVMEKLKSVDGITDVKVDEVIGDDEIYVEVDHEKAGRLGLDVQAIGNTIRPAFSGKIVSNVNLNNKEVDIRVKLTEQEGRDLKDLQKLTVMDQRNNLIPLGVLTHFEHRSGTPFIKRFDYKRSKTITAGIVPGKITAVQANGIVRDYFKELKKEYRDVSYVFGGEQESTNESMESLQNALVLSLIGIFAILVLLFGSYLRPFIIMTTIPLGLVGFSVAFALHGRPISFLALIGVIGLGGIIVNSGIVLISVIDSLREEKKDSSLHEILVMASGLRLRAVVVSSLTTIIGLMPTAYGIGGTDAILVPMTLAMAWGLTSGTLLTLVWVPCAYAILEDWNRLMARLFGGRKARAKLVSTEGRVA